MNLYYKTLGLVVLGLLVLGCAQQPSVQEGAVKTIVKVTLDGQPVEGATVTFSPITGQRSAMGRTDDEGQVEMGTSTPGDGVFPGEYKIAVLKKESDPSMKVIENSEDLYNNQRRPPPAPKATYLIPEKYSKHGKSGLTATISEGRENSVVLELSSSGP